MTLTTQKNLQSGFTIIEIVIVIGISIILLVGLLNLFYWHQRIYSQEEASVRTTASVRSALVNISEAAAQAVTIEASHNFSGTDYTTSGSTLVLKLPAINSSDSVIANTYDYFVFYLNGSSVYLIIEPGAGSIRGAVSKKLADNVQSFALTYNNGTPSAASTVTIDMQAVITTRNNNVTTQVSDTIFLRNK